MALYWNGKSGVMSYNGKVKDWKVERNVRELKSDFENGKDRVEAVRHFINQQLTLEERKELTDELFEEVIEEADRLYLCRNCLTELEETDVEYQDAGVFHGRPVQEPITVELTCPRCGNWRCM